MDEEAQGRAEALSRSTLLRTIVRGYLREGYEIVDVASGEVKKKYVSLVAHEPLKITLEEAIEVIRAKQDADANKLIKDFGVENLRILRGRWGPYLTDTVKNARLPKDRDPETVTLAEAQELIANAPIPKRRWGRPVIKKKVAKRSTRKYSPRKVAPAASEGAVQTAPRTGEKVRKKARKKAAAGKGQGKGKNAADGTADPAAT